jgi:hypothetical protein
MSRLSAPTSLAGAWRKLATNTAVKPVKKLDLRKWRLRASATTHLVRLPHEEVPRSSLRDGDGTFQPPVFYPVFMSPAAYTTARLTGRNIFLAA